MAFIEVNNLSFSYKNSADKKILKNLNFSLEEGSVTAVLGLSGCGKTTLCHCLCGIIPAAIPGDLHGDVTVGGESVFSRRLCDLAAVVGLVMQSPDNQLVCSTVEDEIAFAMENLAYPKDEIRRKVEEILKFMNLQELRLQNPGSLSGGQKQLVAIGAVLATSPQVIIFDEPMSHLDKQGINLITDVIKNLQAAGKTIIIVEHNLELLDFADNWLLLADGEVRALDTPANIKARQELLAELHLTL